MVDSVKIIFLFTICTTGAEGPLGPGSVPSALQVMPPTGTWELGKRNTTNILGKATKNS